jgi:hypothetical protein
MNIVELTEPSVVLEKSLPFRHAPGERPEALAFMGAIPPKTWTRAASRLGHQQTGTLGLGYVHLVYLFN